MSRTDAHVPVQIRIARGDIGHAEVHDHTNGVCDLPDRYDHALEWPSRGHCHWIWLWDGHGVCPCELCHHGRLNRREWRAERQRVRRELRRAAVDPDTADGI
ncbi:MAG: hypothetical protein IT193_08295 [Propionibacteriaceae bacterium]|nr:hypothetical protein [Propionibacteriaceae bacterium]